MSRTSDTFAPPRPAVRASLDEKLYVDARENRIVASRCVRIRGQWQESATSGRSRWNPVSKAGPPAAVRERVTERACTASLGRKMVGEVRRQLADMLEDRVRDKHGFEISKPAVPIRWRSRRVFGPGRRVEQVMIWCAAAA